MSKVRQKLYDQYVTSGQAGKSANATPEAHFAANAPYVQRTIEKFMPADRSSRIVDLGCGHGGWLYFLKQSGYANVAGVDISAQQVQFAHELGIAEVQLGNLSEFIDSEDSVDVVIMMDILEHLTIDESTELLQQISDKVTPGGRLVIHVPNGEGLFGQRIRYGDLTHELCFTPKSMHQLLSPLGFSDIQCFEDRPIVHGLKSAIRRLVWDIGTLFPRLLLAAETGRVSCVLSQNMTVTAIMNNEEKS